MASQSFKRRAKYYRGRYSSTGIPSFEPIVRNLQLAISKIEVASERGLVNAVAHIRVKTEEETPSTPVDLGNLRASWFCASTKGGIEKDPVGLSGSFKNNKLRHIPAAQFKLWHTAALAEAIITTKIYLHGSMVMFGYSANYAMWVHENIGATFKRLEPPAGPKWFENALDRNHDKMLKIIRETSKAPLI